jgi:hypothetical protein
VKYFFGIIFIVIGLAHGIHVLNIEPGSITSLAGKSPLSNGSLDRIASAGLLGKSIVLAIDAAFIALGIYELRRRKPTQLEKNRSKIKAPK